MIVKLKPDLIVTQKLCEVCAITPTDLQKAIRDCSSSPKIVSLHPHSIKDILKDISVVGKAVNKQKSAIKLVSTLKSRINKIKKLTANISKKPRVYCMEWLNPPYNAGHWVPEQVQIAGGVDDLATRGIDSRRLLWQKIIKYRPEILILMPCGLTIERTRQEIKILTQNQYFGQLDCVKRNEVYLVNGPAYFNCSGPRVVDGIELLTKITHPEIFTKKFTRSDLQKL